MSRILVVGDVHGHPELLTNVLRRANYAPERDRLILLGDYIDRGPDARGALELVKELVTGGAVALMGNHEKMLLDALQENNDGEAAGLWVMNGAERTLESFGIRSGCPGSKPGTCGEEPWGQVLPPGWRELFRQWQGFLENLPLIHYEGKYVFVHAGICPYKEVQYARDLLWIRGEFLYCPSAPLPGKVVVFGHTPTITIRGHHAAAPWFAPGRIGVDTGAFMTGVLTCMQLPYRCFWQTIPGAGN